MSGIVYRKGDATQPEGAGSKVLAHVVNDAGAWGRGFVLAVSNRWPHVERHYRLWRAHSVPPFELGQVLFVTAEPGRLWVANVMAQHGLRTKGGVPPIRYTALREGLRKVAEFAKERSATVHMPRIGCGLAGGHWDRVEPIVKEELVDHGLEVTVYDLG